MKRKPLYALATIVSGNSFTSLFCYLARSSSSRERCVIWFALGLITLAFPLHAEEKPDTSSTNLLGMSLEQLMDIKVDSVTGASRYEQKVAEAPASITIVTDDDIKKYGHRTLGDILRSVRGLYVTYDRNYSYLGIRGFSRPSDYNSRILLLVDGHRLNDNLYDSAFIGNEFPIDIDLIDRVEVIRGPSSSIYGNNAFFGVVNVITKKGRDLNGLEMSTSVGSFGSYEGRVTYGKKFSDDVEWLLSGSYYDSAGHSRLFYPEYNSPATNYGVFENGDYESYYSLFTSLRAWDLTLEANIKDRKKGVPTGSFGTDFNDNRANTIDEPAYIDLKYEHTFDHDWDMTARTYYDYYGYKGVYPYAPILNLDVGWGQRVGFETQVTKKINDLHTLTFGAEVRDNLQQDQVNYDWPTGNVNLNDRRSSVNTGVYGQGEIFLRTNLIFNAGLRYDYYSQYGDSVNPRLGLIYSPLEKTTVKLLYGTAFRAPNVFETYYALPGSAKANPDLKPEKIATYELVLEQKLPANLEFDVSGYYYEMKDLINSQIDPVDGLLVYRNLQKVEADGVEVELHGHWKGGIRSGLSYAWQENKDSTTGQMLSNSPRHLAKFNLTAPLYQDKLFAGLEIQYYYRVTTLAGNTEGSFWLANFTLFSQKLAKGLEVSGSIYNLFDSKYAFPGAGEHLQDVIPQDGRIFE